MASQNAHDEHAISEPLSPRVLLSASTSRPLQGQVPARRRELRTRPLELDPSPGFQTPVHASAVRPRPRSDRTAEVSFEKDRTATGRSPPVPTTSSPRAQAPATLLLPLALQETNAFFLRVPSQIKRPLPPSSREILRNSRAIRVGFEKLLDPVRRFEHLAGNWRRILRGSPSEPVSWIFCLEERGGRWVRCGG